MRPFGGRVEQRLTIIHPHLSSTTRYLSTSYNPPERSLRLKGGKVIVDVRSSAKDAQHRIR